PMRMSQASAYALRAVAYLAARRRRGRIASHQIARSQGIPEPFALDVLQALVPAGVLESLRGRKGGYELAKPVADITLLEVIEAIDGPVRGQAPRVEGGEGDELDVRLQRICEHVAETTRRHLGRVRMGDLVKRRRQTAVR